jgi:branched-chain amino acid transport system substrate-binding protein
MLPSRFVQVILLFVLSLTTYLARAETGVSASTITLGMSAPFSGPNGSYGVEMREAIQAYFDQINNGGGVHGRRLKLVALDDGYETERTVANTHKLLDQHEVFALMGYYGSSPTTAAMPVFSAAKTPLIGTISGAATLREPANPYMFNVRASYADETAAIVDHLVSIGMRQIGVLYQNDGFGESGLKGVTTALKAYNLAPLAVATVERNSLDIAAAAKIMIDAKPQAIIMVTLYKPTAAFVRAIKEAGRFPQFVTLSPVGADLLVSELGAEARGIGISQVMPYPWNSAMPVVKEYQRLIEKPGKKAAYSYYGLEGYINAKLVVEALKKAGPAPTRDSLVAALNSMRDFNLGGYNIDYSAQRHNGSRMVELTVIGAAGRVVR